MVYSDVAYVNTEFSAIDEIRPIDADFHAVLNNINDYPENTMSVYSLTGQKVLELYHVDRSHINNLSRYLSQGVYILQVDINSDGGFSVKGKLKI